jgi:hypothetical protein
MFEAQSGLGESEHREPPPGVDPKKKKGFYDNDVLWFKNVQ